MQTKKILLIAALVVGVAGFGYLATNPGLFSGNSFTESQYNNCMELGKAGKLVKGTRTYDTCMKVMQQYKSQSTEASSELNVTKATITPPPQIVIAGRTDVPVFITEFSNTGANTILKDMVLAYTGDVEDDISAVTLYEYNDQTTPLATSYLVGGEIIFNNIDYPIAVQKNKFVVSVDLNTIANGADSGDSFKFSVKGVKALTADGEVSKVTYSTNDVSNEMVVRKTKPTFSVGANINPKLTNGRQLPLYNFSVGAEKEGDLSIVNLPFIVTGEVNGTAINFDADQEYLTNFKLYDVTDGEEVEAFFNSYQYNGNNYLIAMMPTEEEVSAAGKKYSLRADVSGMSENSWVAVKIPDSNIDKVFTETWSTLEVKPVEYLVDLFWSDQSAPDTSKDWTNSYLLKSLPTGGQLMSNY